MNKGFKPLSSATSNNKPKGKKKALRTPPLTGKEMKFITPNLNSQTYQQLINASLLV
jgi:hypothetical protein